MPWPPGTDRHHTEAAERKDVRLLGSKPGEGAGQGYKVSFGECYRSMAN